MKDMRNALCVSWFILVKLGPQNKKKIGWVEEKTRRYANEHNGMYV